MDNYHYGSLVMSNKEKPFTGIKVGYLTKKFLAACQRNLGFFKSIFADFNNSGTVTQIIYSVVLLIIIFTILHYLVSISISLFLLFIADTVYANLKK